LLKFPVTLAAKVTAAVVAGVVLLYVTYACMLIGSPALTVVELVVAMTFSRIGSIMWVVMVASPES